MNLIEKYVISQLHKKAWQDLINQETTMPDKVIKKQLERYHWIIKNSKGQVIYDTETDGYKDLVGFYPVVLEAVDMVAKKEKGLTIKRGKKKTKVIYQITPNLSTFFPTKSLEEKFISA